MIDALIERAHIDLQGISGEVLRSGSWNRCQAGNRREREEVELNLGGKGIPRVAVGEVADVNLHLQRLPMRQQHSSVRAI
jgi:hypothetical protein